MKIIKISIKEFFFLNKTLSTQDTHVAAVLLFDWQLRRVGVKSIKLCHFCGREGSAFHDFVFNFLLHKHC